MLTDKLIKSSPSSRIFISVATVAIISILTYGWIVSPQINYLHAAQRQKTMAHSTKQKIISVKNRVHKRKAKLVELQQEIAGIRDSFFTSKKAKEFFSDLELIASRCGCSINSLTFVSAQPIASKGQDQKDFSKVVLRRVEISLAGRYDGIIRFLEKLSSYPERVFIGSLLVKSSPNNARELICTMAVTIYLVEDKETISDE